MNNCKSRLLGGGMFFLPIPIFALPLAVVGLAIDLVRSLAGASQSRMEILEDVRERRKNREIEEIK